MPKIKAKYKGTVVFGAWFLLGDAYWLLLTKRSTNKVGTETIEMDKLTEISEYP